jgi:hypothetical protein
LALLAWTTWSWLVVVVVVVDMLAVVVALVGLELAQV